MRIPELLAYGLALVSCGNAHLAGAAYLNASQQGLSKSGAVLKTLSSIVFLVGAFVLMHIGEHS